MLTLETAPPYMGLDQRITASPLIHRDTETFHPENGLSWYEGAEVGSIDEVRNGLWLPDHSESLLTALNTYGGIRVIGEVGAGKSTLLYGTRALMRAQGMPYVNINGHHTDSDKSSVINAIDCAEDTGAAVIFDSGDYLVGKNGKIRKLRLDQHLERSHAILNRLIDFRQNDGNLLLTSHHEGWINDRSHPDLLPEWNELSEYTVPIEVNLTLPETDQREALLKKIGATDEVAEFIAGMPDNPQLINHIVDTYGDSQFIDWAQDKLKSYQMLKLLIRDGYNENVPALEAVANLMNEGVDPKLAGASWDEILYFMHSKEYLLTFFTR